MKIRTVYFKVPKIKPAAEFWQKFLGVEPHKKSDKWHEFLVGESSEGNEDTKQGAVRLGLLLNDFGDKFSGSNSVPVFEFGDDEVMEWIEKARKLGAKEILNGLNDPNLKSVVFADPFGNEFEVSKFHD